MREVTNKSTPSLFPQRYLGCQVIVTTLPFVFAVVNVSSAKGEGIDHTPAYWHQRRAFRRRHVTPCTTNMEAGVCWNGICRVGNDFLMAANPRVAADTLI
jgi:hypothetical protein